MSRALSRAGAVAALLAVAAVLAGCVGAPMPVPTPTATPTPTGDGILRIGTLFPVTGPTAFLGSGLTAGVNAAIREINEAGGVLGAPVEVVNRDAGDPATDKAELSFDDLVAQGVDVVIGPSSSAVAQRLLPRAAAAAVPLVSPAATFPQLSTAADGEWFFRTIPSYADQGAVLARLLTDADAGSVALVRTGDELGSSISDTLTASLAEHDGELVADVVADTDPAAVVAELDDADPDAVVLATADNGEATRALITALVAAGYGGGKLWLTSQNLADYSQSLPAGTLTDVNGIVEGLIPDADLQARIAREDPGLASFSYSAEAYDATVLAALAATLARDDGGASIARMLRAASIDGIKCTSYGECLDVLKTRDDIDYDGVTGSLNLDEDGDLTTPGFSRYSYTAENKPTFAEWVTL